MTGLSFVSSYFTDAKSLDECLKECDRQFDLALGHDFAGAMDYLSKLEKNIYVDITRCALSFMQTLLTLEKENTDQTIGLALELINDCDRCLKGRTSLLNILVKPNYKDYSDYLAHALMIKGVATMIYGLMTLVSDSNFMSMVKAAIRLQSSRSIFKECSEIQAAKVQWTSNASRSFFANHDQLYQAFLTLIISHMPEAIMVFLTWFGFDSDRDKAINKLIYVTEHATGIWSTCAKIAFSIYECIVISTFGARPPNVDKVLEITNKVLSKDKQVTWALLFKAAALKLKGELDNAIDYYNRSIDSQKEMKELHSLCYWDLSFCYGLKMDWDLAAYNANMMIEKCNWSRATCTYMKAAFLYMKMVEDKNSDLKEVVTELFRRVPQMKQRFAGKTIPLEKYVCVNAEKYFKQNESLPLPAFDLFYIWNIYNLANNNSDILNPIIERVDDALLDYAPGKCDLIEDFCLLLLIKAICLKQQDKFTQTEKCLEEILTNDSCLGNNLLAMASLEMGLTKLNAKSYTESEQWLKKCQKYKNYFFKMIIHFRAHSALQRLKEIRDKEQKK